MTDSTVPPLNIDTQPVPLLTPGQLAQVRAELAPRRHTGRAVTLALVILTAIVTAAGAGYATGHAHPRTVTHTVTRTVTRVPPPKVVTRTVTKTQTVTVPGTPSIPCADLLGSPEPELSAPGLENCTVRLTEGPGAQAPAQVTLTAPSGDTSTWNLTGAGTP